MNLPSLMVPAGLKDRLAIHRTGTNAYSKTRRLTTDQLILSLGVTVMSASFRIGSGSRSTEKFDEDERDHGHTHEDQHADRGSDAQVECLEQIVVTQNQIGRAHV